MLYLTILVMILSLIRAHSVEQWVRFVFLLGAPSRWCAELLKIFHSSFSPIFLFPTLCLIVTVERRANEWKSFSNMPNICLISQAARRLFSTFQLFSRLFLILIVVTCSSLTSLGFHGVDDDECVCLQREISEKFRSFTFFWGKTSIINFSVSQSAPNMSATRHCEGLELINNLPYFCLLCRSWSECSVTRKKKKTLWISQNKKKECAQDNLQIYGVFAFLFALKI